MPILKWGFPTQSRNCQFTGVNNAGLQTYGSNPISSIVREAVQNSLDAAISPTQTVEIDISYGVIKKEIGGYEDLFNALLSVEEHVSMCKKDYEEASKYNEAKYFDGMLKAINRFRSLGRIPYLRIKDSGTIGMYHNDANPRSGRLCTFIHGDGENNADNQNGGGANGIGISDMVENRLVGMKSRGVYETPGGTILYKAHEMLEQLCLDKETQHLKMQLAVKFSELVYNGQWFTTCREALSAFVDKTQETVTGEVKLKLYKGTIMGAGMTSPYSLYSEEMATFDEDEVYDQYDANGFINLFGLPLKVKAMLSKDWDINK